ncbi:MAG TPA: heavy metal translocating P-type ATPase [Candidatus Peribacteraceae bacterium]|nr:heavy metal translocating P-type ATPase [Candidatus Peribacteraceae bacterium]
MSFIFSRSAIPLFVLVGLAAAGIGYMTGNRNIADIILLITLIVGSIPLAIDIVQSMIHRHFGVDIIAIVAIISSLILHQYLAGTVILLMLSGGEALEGYALRRARKDLTDLIKNAPTVAHKDENGTMRDVPIESVKPGDIVIVKPGESIPVDGEVLEGSSMVDESMLTGESVPVRKHSGLHVMSGSVAKDNVLKIRALLPSSESRYQQIIRLVREAEQRKAPFVRLADRYSVWFTAITFILAAGAWFLSHDPVRLLAVLVVATPCPLILATPIAFASGISRAAGRGIIVKNGGVLEKLGEARSFIFDKTGTLTFGVPSIARIEAYDRTEKEILQISASLDQLSAHILARALTLEAAREQITLQYPEQFEERLGEGVHGTIDGKTYYFGRLAYLQKQGMQVPKDIQTAHDKAQEAGQMAVFLGEGKTILGGVFFADKTRSHVRELFQNLSSLGIQRVMMLTGDKKAAALRVATEIGLKEENVIAECLPENKVQTVVEMHKTLAPVVMVGDGVNDAPAISAADVGIAMGGGGNTASSEAGDIVILIDRIERVGEALCLGHRVLGIAKQSIFIGIGLSIFLMILATFGFIVPVYGALLQEIVDVIVIFNALRVLLVQCWFSDSMEEV